MKKVTVLYGQTIIDLAVQYLGDMERAYEIALLNNLELTNSLVAGTMLFVPAADNIKSNVISVFSDNSKAPASQESETIIDEGIDFWIIEEDFIVQ